MRLTHTLLLALCLAIPGGASAKRPEPIPCPADVPAAVDAACPCDGAVQPDLSVVPWKNHGEYVSCVAHHTQDLVNAGLLTHQQRSVLVSQAGQSNCGKQNANH